MALLILDKNLAGSPKPCLDRVASWRNYAKQFSDAETRRALYLQAAKWVQRSRALRLARDAAIARQRDKALRFGLMYGTGPVKWDTTL